ncbi:hypothetical protein [Microvirga lenta]|uniref:hypothetical protein n=1 Tax=Microvirga lenta TaxID=2881337 RepID=UPI001CFF62A6|nr:hypothetical protein [Microvirga lenta]MCB5176772.1 hypothetical protein [Microvirga lenta]
MSKRNISVTLTATDDPNNSVVDVQSASLEDARIVSPFIRGIAQTMNYMVAWYAGTTGRKAHCVVTITFVEVQPLEIRGALHE